MKWSLLYVSAGPLAPLTTCLPWFSSLSPCSSQVLDGRKPTGGKLEVKARLREPLSGQDVQVVTENWLILEPRGL